MSTGMLSVRNRQMRRIEERKEKGLCTTCGKKEHAIGKLSCDDCLKRKKIIKYKRRIK